MRLDPYVEQLQDALGAAAANGDREVQRAAGLLSAGLEPAARLALMNALSDLAAEVTAALDDRVVEVRLDGRDLRVVVTPTAGVEDEEPTPPPMPEGGDISRITLRLLDEIKAKAERAAAAQGVSLNAWVSQAVQGALSGTRRGRGDDHDGRGGSRVRGWVRG
ncbi:hypothetical protein GCM10012275_06540 [Longimycelium tulufanense]|uniref:Toxin-antitoxin system HicB family antitoxin n=1 Tax=Longimycelium tulufanense TaxID=907463 RepID=A0A8J3CC85_9PSEU|nr:toxin-antitoxin system HicB family antitoxin [Longimycelium tulufanense]GGM38218.1 hypothetical protein GCM10012275_06540 [Longimycelium tulufanense]